MRWGGGGEGGGGGVVEGEGGSTLSSSTHPPTYNSYIQSYIPILRSRYHVLLIDKSDRIDGGSERQREKNVLLADNPQSPTPLLSTVL